jgi:peptidoglycan/xylan/chitin deacetylase (PgdA/CDA1 family)
VKPDAAHGDGEAPAAPGGRAKLDRDQSVILMYHRVGSAKGRHDLSVSAEALTRHLETLHEEGYALCGLEELLVADGSAPRPGRRAALTFDDGYADLLVDALDVLRRHEAPATVFVVAGALESGYEYWWDALSRAFEGRARLPAGLDLPELGTLPTGTTLERERTRERLADLLTRQPARQRGETLRRIGEWARLGPASDTDPRPLDADELLRLAAAPGIRVGAHSTNHVWLTFPGVDREAEVAGSKRRLETLLGSEVSCFAYPYGGHDAAIVDAVRRAGFSLAVTTDPGPLPPAVDRLRLPRTDVSRCGAAALRYRLRLLG